VAARLPGGREASKQTGRPITYTDLLVKLVAAGRVANPALKCCVKDGRIVRNADINIGLAVAIDAGLVGPHHPPQPTR